MRLRLNTTLRAALIAAITAVGFTLTQASGTTIKDAVLTLTDFTQDSITAANQAGWTLTNVTAAESGIFTSTTNQAYITKSTAWTVTTGSGNTARTPWSAILTINVDSLGDSGTGVLIECANNPQQAVGSRYEGIAYDASGNQTLKGAWTGGVWNNLVVTTDLKSYADEDGNVTVGIVYKDGNNGTTIFVGDGDTWKSNTNLRSGNDCAGNPTIFLGDKAGVEYSSLYLFGGVVSDNDMKAMLSSLLHGAVTWTGANGAAWDTATQNWVETGTETPATFSQGADVTFGADAAVKSVTVGENITAGTMNVNGDYTFTVGSEKSLTIGTLSVAAEKKATIAGEGTVGGSITKVGAGTLDVNAAVNMDSLLVQAGDVNIDGKNGTISSLKAANGATVTLTNVTATSINQEGRGDGGYVGNLIIGNGAVVKASRTDGWGFERNNTLTVATGGQLDMQGFRWTFQSKNTIVLDGGEIKGNGDGTYGAIDFDGKGNTVNVTKDSTLSARVRMRNNDEVTFDVDESKNLAFTGEIVNQGNGTLIKAGKGTLTMSGAINNAGFYKLNEGTLAIGTTVNMGNRLTQTGGQLSVLANGNLTLAGFTMTGAIQNAGTLTMTGSYDISALDTVNPSYYVYDEGIAEGNGFKSFSGPVHVVTGAGTLNASEATFTYGSVNVTGLDEHGDCILPETTDYTTLYVNNNNGVSYDAAWNKAQSQTPSVTITSVVMADNTTLTADKSGASFTLVMHGDATVVATAETTISSISGWTKALTISGTAPVSSGDVKLDGADMVLTVAQGATLNVGSSSSKANLTPNEGVVNINGTVNISHEVDLASGGSAKGTINVGGSGVVNVADGMWMNSTAAINIANGGTFNIGGLSIVGKDNGSIVSGGSNKHYSTGSGDFTINNATVTATGDVTIGNTLSGVNVVTGEHTVTLNSSPSAVTVSEKGKLVVNTNLHLAGNLESSGAITVNANKSLTLTEGSSIYETITNNGTVSLTGVTLGAGFEEQTGGTGYFDLAGNKTDADHNHYEGTGTTYVQVVSNGQDALASGTNIDWKGSKYTLQEDGTIVVGNGSPTFGTFYVVEQLGITASAIVASDHYSETQTIDVGDMATLNMDVALTGKTIVTHEYSFIQGKAVTPEAVSFAAGGSTFFSENVTTADGITFTDSSWGVGMSNTNTEGDPVQYSTAEKSIAVQAETMTSASTEAVTVANKVDVSSIENNGTGKLILTNVYLGDEASLASIAANTGDITLQNVDANPVELENLTIALGQTVAVYQGDEIAPNNEGTVTISDTLAAGGGTLLANLTLVGGSMLDVDGGDDKALTLGSTLTIDLSNGGFVNLDQATIDALNSLQNGERLDLIVGTPTATLHYDGDAVGAEWYNDLFYRPEDLVGDYKVYTEGGAFGLEKQSSVPEPTTGTLSLLALAALAARRRRK